MPALAPFADNYLLAAAELLASRHRIDCAAAPHLPPRFAESSVAQRALAALRAGRTGGLIALEDGQVLGYLIGAANETALVGRSVIFGAASYATASALSALAAAELLRDLYAAQAGHWVAQGYFNHYAMVSAASPLLDGWLRLGFAYQQAYALLDLSSGPAAPDEYASGQPPAGLKLRQAKPDDAAALAASAHWLAAYQAGSPIFAPAPPEYIGELRSGYAGLADGDDAAAAWLAILDGEIVGVQAYYAVPPADDNLLSDSGWVELAAAATRPDLRGRGIGRALTACGLAWARGAGYAVCLTDWRVANLVASRFWPRQGFTPVAYRLERRIDPRVAWARGE